MTTTWLIVSAAASALVLLATAALLALKGPRQGSGEAVLLRESPYTVIMAVFLTALCAAILALKLLGYEVGGAAPASYRFCAWFSFMCALMAAYALLYAFMKAVLAYGDGMVVVDLLGRKKRVLWQDITRVKTNNLSRKLVFYTRDDSYAVNGEAESYKKFVRLAKGAIPAIVASDTLGGLDFQLNAGNALQRKRR